MEYRQLGGSGLRVSAVGLGGNTFGRFCDAERSIEIIHRAIDLGVNHIDTADTYNWSMGPSEEIVGKAIAGRRHELVIASKVGMTAGQGPNDTGVSYRRVIAICEQALRRLGTDYIDLYYMHRFDPATPMEEALRAYDDLARAGKIRYVGVSNHPAWKVCEALWVADRRGYKAPIVTQNRYNMLDRSVEAELAPLCRAYGIGIIPYAPLAAGVLTGKYKPGEQAKPGQRGYNNPHFDIWTTDRNFKIVDRLMAFSIERGHKSGELAIAWLLAHPEVSSVITGATSPAQIEANVAAGEWKLSADDVKAVEEILAA